jgi:hypothetical protein
MPHLTFATTVSGLSLPVMIGVDGGRYAALLSAGLPVPPPLLVQGLLDTGSDVTILNPDLIFRLGLVCCVQKATHTTIGSATVKLYEISLSIPDTVGGKGSLLERSPLLAMESLAPFLNIDAVIGLDVLSDCLLIFDGPGKQFTLAI